MMRLFLFCLIAAGASNAFAIDCENATGRVDMIICSVPHLMDQQQMVEELFVQAKAASVSPKELDRSQVRWVKSRDVCRLVKEAIGCIYSSTQSRIVELNAIIVTE